MKQSRTTLCHDDGVVGWALKLRRAKLMRLYYRVAWLPMGAVVAAIGRFERGERGAERRATSLHFRNARTGGAILPAQPLAL